MSGGDPVSNKVAWRHADDLVRELDPLCIQISKAGSLRRGKTTVNDVEIVVQPKRAREFLARLDKWVIDGKVRKASYNGETRWGPKYRGLMYEGIRFEFFLADEHNYGYILWLRTGPGDANHFVMTQIAAKNAPYRARDGYWWIDGKPIHVPDETEMFRLLGISTVIPPHARTAEMYARLMKSPRWPEAVRIVDVPEAYEQGGLL